MQPLNEQECDHSMPGLVALSTALRCRVLCSEGEIVCFFFPPVDPGLRKLQRRFIITRRFFFLRGELPNSRANSCSQFLLCRGRRTERRGAVLSGVQVDDEVGHRRTRCW
jgi:hypothetical protein